MNRPINTTIVSGFPGIGKSWLAQLYPKAVRDLESSDFHWFKDPINDHQSPNPQWPHNYMETIKALDKSGMYRVVMVSSHASIRKYMADEKIRYTNICPQDTPEMKTIFMKRYRDRGSSEEFIQNMDEHWSEYVQGMIQDPGAVATIQLSAENVNDWAAMCFYE